MKSSGINLSAFIDNLQSEGRYVFLRSEALSVLNVSGDSFKLAMHRLAKQNRAKHIRSDFYVIVPLEYKNVGCIPSSWFIDEFMSYMQANYYVGILTAASLHGAAHQQPMVFQIISDKMIRPIRVGRVRLEFHYKKIINDDFSRLLKTETGTMRVSTPEMTIVDIVRYMNAAGQINNASTILYELKDKINIQNLFNYVDRGYVETSIIQRLGYLLEYLKLGFDLTKLAEVVSASKPNYRELVVGNKTPIIKYDKKWRILVNEIVEPDV